MNQPKESGPPQAAPVLPIHPTNGASVAHPYAAGLDDWHSSGNVTQPLPAGVVAPAANEAHGGGLPQAGGTIAAMRAVPRWVLWREEDNPSNPEKPRKVPYYPQGGKRETTDTPEDWARMATYEFAVERMTTLAGAYAGIAFALGPDGSGNCWQGVDLDDVQANRLADIANSAPGLVEFSPSGEGCHAVGYGRYFTSLGSNGTGVEAYASGRYFTVTEKTIRDAPLQCIAGFVEQVLQPRHGSRPSNGPTRSPAESSVPITPQLVSDLRSALMYLRADDRVLWVAVGHALHELGDVGRGLWMDWSATSSEHRPGPDAKTWDTFEPKHTGYAAIFKHAQEAGWINHRSKDAQQPTAAMTPFVPFRAKPLPEFLAQVPVIEFLVDDMLRRGWLYTCTGQPGAGKTGVGVVLALAVAGGGHVGKHACNGGPVLYLASENPDDVNQRFKIAVEKGGWTQDTQKHIHVIDQSFLLKDKLFDLEKMIDTLQAVAVISR